jgi:hypothetical protein
MLMRNGRLPQELKQEKQQKQVAVLHRYPRQEKGQPKKQHRDEKLSQKARIGSEPRKNILRTSKDPTKLKMTRTTTFVF